MDLLIIIRWDEFITLFSSVARPVDERTSSSGLLPGL